MPRSSSQALWGAGFQPANPATMLAGKMPAPPGASATLFDLATPDDDAQLRQLFRETPMGQSIEVAFLREPNFFRAAGMQGDHVQVIVARRGDRIVAAGTRALRRSFINGQETNAGYLADLRLHEEVRGGTVLFRGYRFLRELHADGRADVYSTVIVEDNRRAISTIASGRAGLPTYTPLGRVLTPVISLHRKLPPIEADIVRGSMEMLPQIVAKLNKNRLQFAPAYAVEDFTGGRFPDFRPEDFYVLRRGGRIAGVAGVWDQHRFRQIVVTRYGGWLRLRPLINWFRRPPLPPPGEPLRYFYVSFTSTDDAPALAALLCRIYNDAVGGPWTHFTLALHERDPRAAALSDYRSTHFAGRLYAVTFDGLPQLDARIPFVDAGLL